MLVYAFLHSLGQERTHGLRVRTAGKQTYT
jgi:hypothetical protein